VAFRTSRIYVVKDNKFLLLADLAAKTSDGGELVVGTIVIPSAFVDSANILLGT